jgi:hypothetical protein
VSTSGGRAGEVYESKLIVRFPLPNVADTGNTPAYVAQPVRLRGDDRVRVGIVPRRIRQVGTFGAQTRRLPAPMG